MGRHGISIIEQFPQFKAIRNCIFNHRTSEMHIKHALGVMTTDARHPLSQHESETIKELYKWYEEYVETYLKSYLKGYDTLNPFSAPANGDDVLADKLLRDVHGYLDRAGLQQEASSARDLVGLLAGICAVWIIMKGKALMRLSSGSSEQNQSTLMKPHTVQIIALFRLLKLSKSDGALDDARAFWQWLVSPRLASHKVDMMDGHMARVGTGEGKSVILAILSCFLALTGVRVRCACYSEQLVSRDYKEFQDLFVKFKVHECIKYFTIPAVVEYCINDGGDVRKLVKGQFIVSSETIRPSSAAASKPKEILLIDEVRACRLMCACSILIDTLRLMLSSVTSSWDKLTIQLLSILLLTYKP